MTGLYDQVYIPMASYKRVYRDFDNLFDSDFDEYDYQTEFIDFGK